MSDYFENLILYLALTAFAIYGVFYLAPKVGKSLSETTRKAATVRTDRIKL